MSQRIPNPVDELPVFIVGNLRVIHKEALDRDGFWTRDQLFAQVFITNTNVNTVEEMSNLIAASRAYQNNVEVMKTAKDLMMKTLELGQ